MTTSDKGIDLIKRFEGLRTKAYRCPAGKWTIGYGHTATTHQDMAVTPTQALELLRLDILYYESALNKLLMQRNISVSQNQFDALVSFSFNLGVDNLKKSTLLKRIAESPNHPDIPNQWMRWVYANGTPLNGLRRRRKAELLLYLSKSTHDS